SMGNNPITQIDPLGDDKYKIDRRGNITLKKKTNRDFDLLIGKNEQGLRIQMKLGKGVLASPKSETTSRTHNVLQPDESFKEITLEYKTDSYSGELGNLENMFEFMAQVTDVEWGLFRFGKNSILETGILTTSHDESTVVLPIIQSEYFQGSDFNGHDHIHPGNSKTPSGFLGSGKGDVFFARSLERIFTDKELKFRIYTKDRIYTPYDTQTLEDKGGIIIKRPKKQ
ncbi:MAG: hypothetical protein RLZZ354_72, partial [Pseudomonadota bacterium]